MKVAVAGLGGFAASHHSALKQLEAEGHLKVVGACDPMAASMPEAVDRLKQRGMPIFESLEQMLQATQPDLVTLPTPIPLHAPMHEAVVKSGAACYLEKPPTLWWPELQKMIEVDRQAKHPTRVGFNFVDDPMRWDLKRRILNNEFGRLNQVALRMIWPRDSVYYHRSNWPGRLQTGDHWTLDSPIGNAMAHYTQNVLFWCGSQLDQVGSIASLKAELWRVHPIQTFDTAFVSVYTDTNIQLRIAATHSQQNETTEKETLHLEKADIVFDSWRAATIHHRDGRQETVESESKDTDSMLVYNLRRYVQAIQGSTQPTVTTLKDSRSFVALCDLVLVSAEQIHNFPKEKTRSEANRNYVEGLEAQLDSFLKHETWFAGEPNSVTLEDLDRLEPAALKMVSVS